MLKEQERRVDRINAGENPTEKDMALCSAYMDYIGNNNVVEDARIMRVVKSVVESGKARRRNGAAVKNKVKTEACYRDWEKSSSSPRVQKRTTQLVTRLWFFPWRNMHGLEHALCAIIQQILVG